MKTQEDLVIEYQDTTHQRTRNRIFKALLKRNRGFFHFMERLCKGEKDREDLHQELCLGLLAAIEDWDRHRGFKFNTFLFPRLRGKMTLYFRKSQLITAPTIRRRGGRSNRYYYKFCCWGEYFKQSQTQPKAVEFDLYEKFGKYLSDNGKRILKSYLEKHKYGISYKMGTVPHQSMLYILSELRKKLGAEAELLTS